MSTGPTFLPEARLHGRVGLFARLRPDFEPVVVCNDAQERLEVHILAARTLEHEVQLCLLSVVQFLA